MAVPVTASVTQLIRPGASVLIGAEVFEVVDFMNMKTVLVVDAAGKQSKQLIRDIKPLPGREPKQTKDLASIDKETWNSALRTYQFVKALMDMPDEDRTLDEVQKIAKLVERHPSTVYRWIEKYKATGRVSSLIRKERTDKGVSKLSKEIENIIETSINDIFLDEQRQSVTAAWKEVKKRCSALKLAVPDLKTVTNRVEKISPRTVTERRMGKKAAREQFDPLRGPFPNANFPMAVIQIDHTPMDVIIVDDMWRKPINRAYLTLALDVNTKVVPAFFISLEKPGALATGQCMSRAMLDKEEWLASLGLDKEDDPPWPCWGQMRTVHMDNAKEFRGTMMGLACKERGINVEFRPKGKARYGGHVERGFRTFMAKVHEELPGTTFSNVQQKFEYDSEHHAVMTLGALERWFTIYLLGVYHQEGHAGNDGIPPIVAWQRAYLEGTDDTPPTGIPHRISDRVKLERDFMPYFEGTVQEYGILKWGVYWYSDSIRKFIHMKEPGKPKEKRKFVVRYDPRDLSRLQLYDSDANAYIEIPFRDITRPPISLWELRQAKRELAADAKGTSNEELIFRQIDKMRALVKVEAEKTKSARRDQQRQREWAATQKKNATRTRVDKPKIPPKSTEVQSGIDEAPRPPPQPFNDIRES
jgi:putative transposase